MLSDDDVKKIQQQVFEYSKKHDIPLLPGAYKRLFLKFAKKEGFSEEDCLNADRDLAFEKLSSKASKLKDEKIKKIHVEIEQTKEALVVHLDESKKQLDESIETIVKSKPGSPEFKKRIDTFIQRYSQLMKKLQDIKESMEIIEGALNDIDQISIQDPVTLLGNCRYFEMVFNGELYTLKRYKTPVTLMIITLRNIAQIRERYGISVEHAVIRSLASIIYENIRSSDVLCRCESGDFRILLHNTDIEKADLFAQKIRYLLGRVVFQKGDERFKVKIAYGLTALRENDTMESALMRIALKQ